MASRGGENRCAAPRKGRRRKRGPVREMLAPVPVRFPRHVVRGRLRTLFETISPPRAPLPGVPRRDWGGSFPERAAVAAAVCPRLARPLLPASKRMRSLGASLLPPHPANLGNFVRNAEPEQEAGALVRQAKTG